MYLDENYTMYEIAYYLVAHEHFDVLEISEKEEEIWLEKYSKNTSTVVRLLHKGFDWKNHLKKDIALVFQKAKAIKRLLAGKHVELHNVYVSAHAPVDDWEILRKPMQLNERNPVKMNVYYLAEDDLTEEKERLFTDIGSTSSPSSDALTVTAKEEAVEHYKRFLMNALHHKKQEAKNVFSFGKPFLTYLLLGINIILFFIFESTGSSTSIDHLIEFGAKYNPAIVEEGQWWRIISSMFLHIGFLHLLMNMLAVYYLGTLVERMYGSWRFFVIYFLAGIAGGLASFAFSTNVSAGASGALFGLFGAILFFGCIHKKLFFQTMGSGVLLLIGINIVFGFTISQIDMGAHLGGLIGGFIASAIIHLPKNKNVRIQFLAFIVYLLMTYGLVAFGLQHNVNSQSYQLMKIEELLMEDNYEGVIDIADHALELSGDLEATILFQRSYAYIEMNQVDQAIEDLENSIKYDDALPQAYQNLALLYYNKGEEEKAEEMVQTAYEMNPDDEDVITLYEEITGENVN
ncbi:rhomboid family intramembrane serine protease [Virgibacillus sp. NKC19-3]|uniref:rhomboid family intramembrane serine protease n=1 Tax=Virgibacillus saliphilus TaxID=2831674 RepID=UPI001C9A9B00|nr:rhomboid family intramembrane serine protease [Virgibacillus sp. NKC19-3]MBY7143372.1 rhomboid family intramembrane serine protease [Virgibacillus sp. NKC19-3]